MRLFWCLILFVVSVLFTDCKKDPAPAAPDDSNAKFANDYFPMSRTYLWTYISNAFTPQGKTYSLFDMKIDTAKFHGAIYPSIKVRPAGETVWRAAYGLLDSENVVYILTDSPPGAAFPLFKHSYDSIEGIQESITISRVTYQAMRVTITTNDYRSYTMWFAKGVGLIKDSSAQGISVFNDENGKHSISTQSTLSYFQK